MTSSETATDFLVLGLKDGPGPHSVKREGLVVVVLEQNADVSTWKYQEGLELLSDTTLPGRQLPGASSGEAWLLGAGEPERTQLVFIRNDNPQETFTFEISVE